ERYGFRQLSADAVDLRVNGVGHFDSVAIGLPVEIEQHRRFAIGSDARVDRHYRVIDRSHVADTDRRSGWAALDDDVGDLAGRFGLAAHQAEDELVVGLDEPGRVDHVAAADGVENIRN